MLKKKVIVIGCGSRGKTYTDIMKNEFSEDFEVVACAEPIADRRNYMQCTHNLPDEMCFESWEPILAREKFADIVIIATMDRDHYAPAMAAIEKGYDLLLEKPVAPTPEQCREIQRAAENKGVFAPAFELITAFSDVLENKADFGVRLKSAYDAGDRATLAAMAEECDTVLEKLRVLKDAHRKVWLTYNKPFGFEAHDIRYGGLIARFETVKLRVASYLSGEVDSLPELEEKRLRLDCLDESAEPFNGYFNWFRYEKIATACILG